MNTNQLEGQWRQLSVDLKKQWGKLTEDDLLQILTDHDLLQIHGNYEKFQRKLEEYYGDRKEEVIKWAERWYRKQEDPQAAETAVPMAKRS